MARPVTESRHFWAALLHLLNTVLICIFLFGVGHSSNACNWFLCYLTPPAHADDPPTFFWCTSARLCEVLPFVPAASVVSEFVMSLGEDDDWVGSWVRWFEYSISAGLMLYLIATLSGAGSMPLVIFLVTTNCTLQFFGWLIETLRAEEDGVSAVTEAVTSAAWVLFGCQWAVIVASFVLTVRHATEHVPNTVYAIIVVLFVFFLSFGINQWLWVHGYYERFARPPTDTADIGYTALSWTSKSSLLWMIYFGVIRERSS